MPNTSEISLLNNWVNRQEDLIKSFRLQPLLVVLRPGTNDLECSQSVSNISSLIEKLKGQGVRHIEIAWSNHPNWEKMVFELKKNCADISLGAASITNLAALQVVAELDLAYAMTPVWNPELQSKAIVLGQVLIPGVFSPTEIQQASQIGCRIVKLFPATSLGINYLNQVKGPIESLPFVIASGGLSVKELDQWLDKGYGAIALGRGLIKNCEIDPDLKKWLLLRKRMMTIS